MVPNVRQRPPLPDRRAVPRRYHPAYDLRMAMTLRTDEQLDRALTELAELEGLSKQEVVRRAVLERRDRLAHRTRVVDVATQAAEEYAEALHRLGTV